jgi:hypothetical protein
MSAVTYTTGKATAEAIAATVPAEFVIECGGKAVIKVYATNRGEFMTYRTREAAEADLGAVLGDLPAASVHHQEESV